MALRPEISLSYKQPEPMSLANWAQLANQITQQEAIRQQIAASQQQVAASQAQQRVTEAQLPGVQAEAEEKTRKVAFPKWFADNSKNFVNPQTGKIDTIRLMSDASSKGFITEAQAIYGDILVNEGRNISNATNEQARGVALSNYIDKGTQHASLILHNLPEKERMPALTKQVQLMNSTVPGSGDQLLKIFTTTDPKTNLPVVDSNKVGSVRESTMGVSEAEKLRQEQTASYYTPQGRDPNSDISKRLREHIRKMGGTVPDLSSFEIVNNPLYADYVKTFTSQSVVPVVARAEAAASALEIKSLVKSFEDTIKVARASGKDILGTVPGTIGSVAWQRFIAQNEKLSQLETQIQVYNNRFPNDPIKPEVQSIGQIIAKLEAGKQILVNESLGKEAFSRTATLPTEPGEVPPSKMPPAKEKTPEGQRVRDLKLDLVKRGEMLTTLKPTDPMYKKAQDEIKDVVSKMREAKMTEKEIETAVAQATGGMTPKTFEAKTVKMAIKSPVTGKLQTFDVPEDEVKEAESRGLKRVSGGK